MENIKILIETSARHVHLTDEDLKILFGEEAKLTVKKELSQIGQFACNERVKIVGPKNSLDNVVIIGPTRKNSQVEISFTDARALGLNPPVRLSGDIKNSSGCKLIGPAGEVELKEGVIVAKRHIHMDKNTAKKLEVNDNDEVKVKINTGDRTLTFENVPVRISDNFNLAMHIDTDEANAAGCKGTVYGEIIK